MAILLKLLLPEQVTVPRGTGLKLPKHHKPEVRLINGLRKKKRREC